MASSAAAALAVSRSSVGERATARVAVTLIAVAWLTLFLLLPLVSVFVEALRDGLSAYLAAVVEPDALAAIRLTLLVAAIAVPLNTVFGVLAALVLVRHRFPGRGLIDSLINLPFAVSPVVIGLALFLVYGVDGFIGGPLSDAGIEIIFSTPGLVLATVFVSLPFVVREVQPVLQEIGTDQEQAAQTLGANAWQTFWRVTLPSIRWGVTYGVVLATARALGEFGAVAVVSGRISGQTETLPLFVQNEYDNFNLAGAYAAAILLAILAISVLVSINFLRRRSPGDSDHEPGLQVIAEPTAKEA